MEIVTKNAKNLRNKCRTSSIVTSIFDFFQKVLQEFRSAKINLAGREQTPSHCMINNTISSCVQSISVGMFYVTNGEHQSDVTRSTSLQTFSEKIKNRRNIYRTSSIVTSIFDFFQKVLQEFLPANSLFS